MFHQRDHDVAFVYILTFTKVTQHSTGVPKHSMLDPAGLLKLAITTANSLGVVRSFNMAAVMGVKTGLIPLRNVLPSVD